jgi:outer membrane protein assembly factor BamB
MHSQPIDRAPAPISPPRSLRGRLAVLATLSLWALASTGMAADEATVDWPSFRGAQRNGVTTETGLLTPWPEGGLQPRWSVPLGEGYASISVVGDRLFTLFAEGETEYLASLDPGDGTVLWKTTLGAKVETEFGNGPRSTPAVSGDTVYAVGSDRILRAAALGDGAVRWQVDLAKEFGARPLRWGFATSPLVDGDLVLLEVGAGEGKGVAALDAATGKTRWTALTSGGSYGSPIAVTLGGIRQYIVAATASRQVVGLNREGQTLWSYDWAGGTMAMPLLVGENQVFVSASEDVGGALLRIEQQDGQFTVEEVWRNREMKNHFSSSLAYEGYLYGFDGATLKCVDAATGERQWVQRGLGKGSLIAADGHLIILSDRGKLVLAKATPEGFQEAGGFQVLEGKTWTAPVLAGGRLYLRDHEKLVCLDVRATPPEAPGARVDAAADGERGAS